MYFKTSAVASFAALHPDAPVWASVAMREMEADIACAVRCDLNVLITGETGVGKKSVAHRIHRQSVRASVPLVVAHSPGALEPSDAFEAALLEAFPDGAALLEYPERLSPEMQSRLQRFVDRSPIPGCGGRPFARGSQVRFITATSGDLFKLVRGRQFSESLFYRLNAIHLIIPPLRERAEDIPALLQEFLAAYAAAPVPRLSTAIRRQLAAHPWPGNLWELRAVAESLASLDRPHILELDDLPPGIRR
jgi:DNA-binding NtrC family response regulator